MDTTLRLHRPFSQPLQSDLLLQRVILQESLQPYFQGQQTTTCAPKRTKIGHGTRKILRTMRKKPAPNLEMNSGPRQLLRITQDGTPILTPPQRQVHSKLHPRTLSQRSELTTLGWIGLSLMVLCRCLQIHLNEAVRSCQHFEGQNELLRPIQQTLNQSVMCGPCVF